MPQKKETPRIVILRRAPAAAPPLLGWLFSVTCYSGGFDLNIPR
jgi:hypothetical protein